MRVPYIPVTADCDSSAGRPRKWLMPVSCVRFPTKYIDALREIALEWQENESLACEENTIKFDDD